MSVMITGDQFGKAEPRQDRIAERAGQVIRPLLAAGLVPVVGGFVGATEHGIITTLGRGGATTPRHC
jgi:aspartate kinase